MPRMYTDTINNVSKLLSGASKPVITIVLDNPQATYTTFSPLSGQVEIISPTTTTFSSIEITFEGSTATYVEKMTTAATNYRSTAAHTFLKLTMPIPLSSLPPRGTLIANTPYKFPFNFAVPNQLLPQSCTHSCTSRHVHFAHLSLPPSMGNCPQLQDLAPDMSKITYGIKAKINKYNELIGKPQKLSELLLPLNILPANPEKPPMSIEIGDKDYCLLKSKGLKKGLFKGKLGRVTLQAEQPRDFMLSVQPTMQVSPVVTSSTSNSSALSSANFSPFSSDSESNSAQSPTKISSTALTYLKLNLTFTPDPSHPTAQPPRLSSLSSKLRSSTFYAGRASVGFPIRSQLTECYDPNSGLYENTMSLPSRNISSLPWTKNAPSAPPLYEATAPTTRRERRSSDSGYSTSSDNNSEVPRKKKEMSASTATGITYTAEINLPLSLPLEKTTTWLPTFHSCLVSRTYTLELSLSLEHGTIVPTTSISLKVPVRIGVLATGERRGSGVGPLTIPELSRNSILASRASVVAGGADDLRVVLPPRYEVFVGSGFGMAQRRRGSNLSYAQSLTFSNGVTADTSGAETDGLSLTTGGEWGMMSQMNGHGGR